MPCQPRYPQPRGDGDDINSGLQPRPLRDCPDARQGHPLSKQPSDITRLAARARREVVRALLARGAGAHDVLGYLGRVDRLLSRSLLCRPQIAQNLVLCVLCVLHVKTTC
ncbi:hypothetical protein PsYK624_168190 [Phanerochaete sordida]|uniref:Uncharacterized protein n=1 Tax=Phanerochaete sordida TaxID=48140 RepID=A0A9P3LMG0_9APHY|nr:hypothetical protein PsYK624_168190 [Phanerochaete sordida]